MAEVTPMLLDLARFAQREKTLRAKTQSSRKNYGDFCTRKPYALVQQDQDDSPVMWRRSLDNSDFIRIRLICRESLVPNQDTHARADVLAGDQDILETGRAGDAHSGGTAGPEPWGPKLASATLAK